MKNTRVQHFDILKSASLATAKMRPQDFINEKSSGQSDAASLKNIEVNTRKNYLLERRYTPHVGDKPFDHLSINRIAGLPDSNVQGFSAPILRYQVQSGSDLIVTQFNFFCMLENYQPLPWPRAFAGPLEYATSYDFRIYVNGIQPIIATNHFTFTGAQLDASQQESGFVALTEDPEKFSPSYDGMHFVAPKSSLLAVDIFCHWPYVIPINGRHLYIAGSRVRGFLTNSEDLDRMNK